MKKIVSIFLAAIISLSVAVPVIAYQVKKGDTLSKIAREHNTTVAELVNFNGIENANLIYPNQSIDIPEEFSDELLGATPTPTSSASVKYVEIPDANLFNQAVTSDTTLTVNRLVDIYNNSLTMSDFGDIGFGRVDPEGDNISESFTFTGITTNSDGTKTLTGIKSALAKYPYTQTSGLVRSHSIGAIVRISNTAAFYDTFANKENNELVDGQWYFGQIPTVTTTAPSANNQLITKGYADGLAFSGAPDASLTIKGIGELATGAQAAASAAVGSGDTTAALILHTGISTSTGGLSGNWVVMSNTSGKIPASWGGSALTLATLNSAGLVVENPASATTTPTLSSIPMTNASTTELNRWVQAYERQYIAGEPINAASVPQAVYLSQIDGRVYKASSNFTSSTFRFVGFVGKTQNVTTSENVWVTGGEGAVVPGFSGLTTGDDLYVSTTGTIANSAGVVPWKIAQVVSTTAIVIEKAPRKYIGVLNQNIAPAPTTAASVTTTINVGFKAKSIKIIGIVGTGSSAGPSSKFLAAGFDPNTTNNPLWYEGTTYGFERDDLGSTLSDSSSYLMSMTEAANTFSRLLVLSTTQNAVTFLWEYRCNGNGNSDDNAWINVLYIIEE